MCIVKQKVTEKRHWSMPGGKLEFGETLSDCVSREFIEETGLVVHVKELVYVTDRIAPEPDTHVVHMVFLVERTESTSLPEEWTHLDPAPSASADELRTVRMVPVNEIEDYGFSSVFHKLVQDDFPGRGGYKGDFFTFYGE
ncbi:MAG: NUDIX domain-containing protein [Dehalococcoidales bacterium]|nr:NUDIX domain-containing protein [Dehalococcoidales bacterium]